jgi:plastocyanin
MFRRRRVAAAVITAVAVGAAGASAFAASEPTVKMRDACDEASFNAVVGPGTCIDAGNVTFDEFVDSLVQHQNHPLWNFTPTTRTVELGSTVDVANVGGEFHTFSRTDEFGGGFVEFLNDILGLTTIADGCMEPPGPTNAFVDAGDTGTISTTALGPGTHKFICCIHPWMQSTLTVR